MEALARLQSVQATLQLMQQYSLCSNDESSDRFVAEFFLFLTQNCTEAELLSRRCATLVQLLPKVSTTFLQALSTGESKPADITVAKEEYRVESPSFKGGKLVTEVGRESRTTAAEKLQGFKNWSQTTSAAAVKSWPMLSIASYGGSTGSAPSVRLRAMEKARSTLEDFCRSYFMFHEMDVGNPHHLFKYLPILYFVEAFIYQLDDDNEEKLQPPVTIVAPCAPERLFPRRVVDEIQVSAVSVTEEKKTGDAAYDAYIQTCSDEEKDASNSWLNELRVEADPFRELRDILNRKGLMTDRIESELKDGVEYWRLERKICESMKLGRMVTKEEVFKAVTLKSFDYRILNHLLYSVTQQRVVEAHLEFLAVAELLVEIADDLFDYEEDVLKNSFNILRMLVYVCGPTDAAAVLANFISRQETKYQQLLEKLEPSLAKKFQERCEEAVKEGGGVSKSGTFGSWTIPPLIVDEDAFRTQVSCKHAPIVREV